MEIFEVSPGLFIWSALTFVLLVALLYKFAFGPLMELQQQRQDEIHESIRAAERLREEAREALRQIQKEVADITLAAAEKVTKKSLSDEEHLHLIKEAIEEVDLGAVAEK